MKGIADHLQGTAHLAIIHETIKHLILEIQELSGRCNQLDVTNANLKNELKVLAAATSSERDKRELADDTAHVKLDEVKFPQSNAAGMCSGGASSKDIQVTGAANTACRSRTECFSG